MKKITILASILFAACAAPQPSTNTNTPETAASILSETFPAHPTQTLTPIPTETPTKESSQTPTLHPSDTPTELPGELTLVTLADAILTDEQMDKYPDIFPGPADSSGFFDLTSEPESPFAEIYESQWNNDVALLNISLYRYFDINDAEQHATESKGFQNIIGDVIELSEFNHHPLLPANTWIRENTVTYPHTYVLSASHKDVCLIVSIRSEYLERQEFFEFLNYIAATLVQNLIDLGY